MAVTGLGAGVDPGVIVWGQLAGPALEKKLLVEDWIKGNMVPAWERSGWNAAPFFLRDLPLESLFLQDGGAWEQRAWGGEVRIPACYPRLYSSAGGFSGS